MKQEARELVSEVHFQHSIWKNELFFYLHQLGIFEERLRSIDHKETSDKLAVEIIRFQENFAIQRKEIEKLLELINKNEQKAVKYGQLHLRRVDYIVTEEYHGLEKEVALFEKLYKDIKVGFYDFLAKMR